MESFTIITTEPNELVQPVHNCMPVIVPTGRQRAMAWQFSNAFRRRQIIVEGLS
jgi:putative SOS response-associated peptidase YedK